MRAWWILGKSAITRQIELSYTQLNAVIAPLECIGRRQDAVTCPLVNLWIKLYISSEFSLRSNRGSMNFTTTWTRRGNATWCDRAFNPVINWLNKTKNLADYICPTQNKALRKKSRLLFKILVVSNMLLFYNRVLQYIFEICQSYINTFGIITFEQEMTVHRCLLNSFYVVLFCFFCRLFNQDEDS